MKLSYYINNSKVLYISVFIFTVVFARVDFAKAQDIHFSQFYNSPLNLNPANTGIFDGDYRFVGNLKNQWSTVPVPYNSSSLSADTRIKLKKNNLGVGLLMNQDKPGDSRFKTFNTALSIAYHLTLDSDSSHFLSGGIQAGVTSKSLNYSALSFNNYSGALPHCCPARPC